MVDVVDASGYVVWSYHTEVYLFPQDFLGTVLPEIGEFLNTLRNRETRVIYKYQNIIEKHMGSRVKMYQTDRLIVFENASYTISGYY